jgi:Ca-activated chloride channel family protein
MSTRITSWALIIFTAIVIPSAVAQIAIPVHYEDMGWECWSIRERTVDITVRDQAATVSVTDEVVNPCSQTVEIEYLFPLPPDAAVDQFTLVVDGRELTGRIMDAGEARRVYDDIVRKRRDPGLLEYAGYGFYRSSAFPLAPGKSAQLVVHYSSICKKDGDIVELWYPMTTGRFCAEPVGHFSIRADIQSAADIAHVYSPSVDLRIDRRSPNRVEVSYEARGYRPLADFQLFYEASRDQVGATFFTYWPDNSSDGYYMMLVSPSPRTDAASIMPKDIVVVLDRSGSMSGEKIRQARDAARFVLNNLNRGDRFNFITYNDKPTECFSSMKDASRENVNQALERLDRMEASGGTNIYDALDVAMSNFSGFTRRFINHNRPAYVIFLTDGLPTVGNVKEADILTNTCSANKAHVRLFTFGVGYDVNARLLDKLVGDNHGRGAYVKPNESIESKVSALYTRIKNPFMTDVTASLEHFSTRDDCPSELGDLFEGDQLIRVGRIFANSEASYNHLDAEDCPATLTVNGFINGEQHSFEYPVTLNRSEHSRSYQFVEKVWAVRRIGQLLQETQRRGRVEEIVDELIRLSKRYGIVTPYTSYLADERSDFAAEHETRANISQLLKKAPGFKTDPEGQMRIVARDEALSMAAPQAMQSSKGYAMRIGATSKQEYESGVAQEISTIRIVGNETLYKRGDVWMTSSVGNLDPVRDRAKFTIIQRYSDEYFALTRDNSSDENKVLASQKPNEKLAILLRGTAYIIE